MLVDKKPSRSPAMQLTPEQELDIKIFEMRLQSLSKEDLAVVARDLYRGWIVRENLLKSMLVGMRV